MLDPKELRVQLQNTCNAPEKYSHYSHIDFSNLPEEPVAIDPGVIDAAIEFKIRQDIMAARLRGEKRVVEPVRR